MDFWEFLQSWTFMGIMAGLLCFLVLFTPLFIVLVILYLHRANRESREESDQTQS